MLLVKNKLKKKRTIDDDEYLNYLKFSHLQPTSKNKRFDIEISDKATQYPDIRNNFTQTINTEDKGVDTYDDLNVVVGDYDLYGTSKNFDKNEKMAQVNTLKRANINSPPSSSSSSNHSEGFLSKTTRQGFRLAEFALNTAVVGANLTMALSDALVDLTSAPHQSSEEEHEVSSSIREAVNNPEVISVRSSPPETINSSPPITVNSSSSSSSRQVPSSIPAPTSPQPSSPASSAKTTPRKKSK